MRQISLHKSKNVPLINWSARFILLAISGCLVLGCNGEPGSGPGESVDQGKQAVSQPAKTEATQAQTEKLGHKEHKGGYHKRHGHGKKGSPIVALVHAALKTVELTDEQRTKLKEIHDKKHEGKSEDIHEAKTAFHQALVKAVEKGEMDVSAFDSQFEAIENGRKAKLDSRKEMLNELHALLQPEQRKALSDAARTKIVKHGEGGCGGDCPMKKHDGHGPHGKGGCGGDCPMKQGKGGCGGDCPMKQGKSGCGGDCPMKQGKGGCGGDCPMKQGKGGCGGDCPMKQGKGGCGGDCPMKRHGDRGCPIAHLRKLTKGLVLTAEQQPQVDALFKEIKATRLSQKAGEPKKDEKKARIVAIFDVFEKDTFDAGAIDFPGYPEGNKVKRMKAHVENLTALVKILTEDQRKQLAAKIEKRFPKNHATGHHADAKETEASL
ncbi:MAG: hypothetical protein GY854_23570 [Deltaproteobacteria bacterium]|nr:hypothetical protein [Deltaproteobacteria bacterium]